MKRLDDDEDNVVSKGILTNSKSILNRKFCNFPFFVDVEA